MQSVELCKIPNLKSDTNALFIEFYVEYFNSWKYEGVKVEYANMMLREDSDLRIELKQTKGNINVGKQALSHIFGAVFK